MEQEKKLSRPTPEEMGKLLQESCKRMQERMSTDPAYKEKMNRLDRVLFGPQSREEDMQAK